MGDPWDTPPGVAFGNMISQSTWETAYDFVVGITKIDENGDSWGCTGSVQMDKVITAAHCAENAKKFIVQTTTQAEVEVTNYVVHPNYTNGAGDPYDVMVLTLATP